MPISSKVDITKIQYVVNSIASKNSLVYRKNYTVQVLPKNLATGKSLYENIHSELIRLYPQLKLKKEIDGDIGKIRVTENGYGYIKIQLEKTKGKTSSVLKPGEAYELYFHSVINDELNKLKELREEMDGVPSQIFDMYNNVTLNLYGGGKKISIGPIKSADKVGQSFKKPDISIKTKNGKDTTISLKQGNFSFWSSADTYQNVPKKILENTAAKGIVSLKTAPNGNTVFDGNVGGIRVPATIDEIKKYCFGGPSGVDYIVINAKLTGVNRNIISMSGINIFKNNNSGDLMRMSSDVYLVIRSGSSRSASAMFPYKGFTVNFVNRAHAFDPRNRYIDGVR
jgi:hypothetical protein